MLFVSRRLKKQMARRGAVTGVLKRCFPYHGVPETVTPFYFTARSGLSSFTIVTRSPNTCRQRDAWVDFPVPEGAVKSTPSPSRVKAEP